MGKQLLDDQVSLSLITLDQIVYHGDVSMVIIPGEEGDFGVLPRHEAFATTLRAGEVKIYLADTVSHVFKITGGVAEIVHDRCHIVADGLAA